MPQPIEDYALIGNTRTAALVGKDGSIDWLCLPRFDSPACFAALLGGPENGRWLIRPEGEVRAVRRRYREGSMILETEFDTEEGTVRLIDFMPVPHRHQCQDVIRICQGIRGSVRMRMELILRFDYGRIVPWLRRPGADWQLSAIAGPDAVHLHTPLDCEDVEGGTFASFVARANQSVPFVLNWHPSHRPAPAPDDAQVALEDAGEWWRGWMSRCTYSGYAVEAVHRSLATLKALTYSPTGGLVAAPTTSLPEAIGGVRNWDYRYCWLRDATLTLLVLLDSGYREEAIAWREWLLRAVAGKPEQLNIMYGIAGERRLQEYAIDWLPGYAGSRPVRVGNLAYVQMQLDVYGEVMDTFHAARRHGIETSEEVWHLQKVLMDALESTWDRPDEGIWEVRGPRRHFTHSRVMAWVAVDRMVKSVEKFGLDGPVERWRNLGRQIREDVCRNGYDAELGTFVQYYGGRALDAALLMIPLVGFLPTDDERVQGTLRAIENGLMVDGLVHRYTHDPAVDGLPPGEGAFLACNFWYVDNLVVAGRHDDAQAAFDHLLSLRNDVGLLAEEYDPVNKRHLGNFPQAFSHVGLINSAYNLSTVLGPARQRSEDSADGDGP